MAFIVPTNVFTQISVDNFKKGTNDVSIQYFDNYEKAKTWIAEAE